MKRKSKVLNTILEKVGNRLGELRKRKGYDTIKDFAEDHNLPPVQYWRIEKGRSNLTVNTLVRLMDIHKLTIEEFFCFLKTKAKLKAR